MTQNIDFFQLKFFAGTVTVIFARTKKAHG